MKKKSVKKACQDFLAAAADVKTYALSQAGPRADWSYEYAVIRLYRDFERLVLAAIVGAVNNDSTTIRERTGVSFPKHMTDDVCEYLIVGDGYFDFRGRDGLIRTVRGFVPDAHYLIAALKDAKYRSALEKLSSFRNYAAHDSPQSKAQAKRAVNQVKLTSPGKWLAKQGRFAAVCDKICELVKDIEKGAPY